MEKRNRYSQEFYRPFSPVLTVPLTHQNLAGTAAQPWPSTLPYFGSPAEKPSPDLGRPQVAHELQWGLLFCKVFSIQSKFSQVFQIQINLFEL
jgi:hypothetical protein